MTNKEAAYILSDKCHEYTVEELHTAFELAIKALKEKPRGEWIEHYDCSDGFTWLTCTRCMFKAYEDDYNFCPNCGADMRGGRE